MHIPDGFIDLPTSVAGAVLAVPAVALSTRQAGRKLADREIPLAGLVAAYLVVAQLLVFPVGLGTGAHLLGTGLALVLVGPYVAMACVSIVLVLQSLLFADGGISALGLNALNNGVVPILVAWAVLAVALRAPHPSPRAVALVAGAATAAATFAGALAFCVELAIGSAADAPTGIITAGFLGAHVVISLIEGVLTALLVRALLRTRPDLVLRWRHRAPIDEPVAPRVNR